MVSKGAIPANAEVAIQSVRWAIQSRADENESWRTENDNTPGLSGDFEQRARQLLRVYRNMRTGRESRLAKQTIVCFDEPMEG